MTTRTVTALRRSALAGLATILVLLGGACGGSDIEVVDGGSSDAAASDAGLGQGVRVVDPAAGGAILDNPPPGLVVLDVRTPAEYEEGHLPGATLVDLNAPDFADRLAELDPDVPYLLYCRSGNRSAQARAMMEQLGFADVADVDGGIVAWADAGLPVER
jgi:phage shock protein E